MAIDQVTNKLSGRVLALVCAVITALGSAWVLASDPNEAIAERIAPVGNVCLSGDDCAAAPVAAAPAGPRSGQELYDTKCTTCHAVGVSGAPRFGNADDWAPRVAQGDDSLFNNAWNGLNAMPPKGLCGDCSEDEIKAAITYMVDNSK